MKRVRFSIKAPDANLVLLAGDFTDWAAKARKMRKTTSRGSTFSTIVSLAPGVYEYKFIVDGEWIPDPKADRVINQYGTENSRIEVSA